MKKGGITTDTERIEKKSTDPTPKKPIFNKTVKYIWNGQFTRQIPHTKIKSGSGK